MSEKTIRREDARLLTGSGRYTADWNLSGQLYAYFLRSDRAHAEIVAVDAGAATARKGVHLVLTGADYTASGWKSLPGGVPYEGVRGQKQKKPFWPALAHGKVHYVGQPVALIVADSAALAQDASEDIAVEYRDLPAAVGFEAATAASASQLHADIPGNLAFEYESGDRAAVEAVFAGAALTSRLTVRSQRLVGNPIEPRAFLASFDAGNGVFTVHSPSQGMNNMRGFLSSATGLPPERIRVITELVGGSFGIRSYSYAEHVAVMLAAQKLGRPVKWVATRSEIFRSDNHGRGLTLTGELAQHHHNHGRRVPDPGNVRAHALCLFERRSGLGLSWRRAARHRLRDRAPCRSRRGRARLRPERAAAEELHSAGGDALQDRERNDLRLRRVRESDGQGIGARRLERFPSAPRTREARREAARHRHRDL